MDDLIEPSRAPRPMSGAILAGSALLFVLDFR